MDQEFLQELEDWQHKLRNFLCGLAEIIEKAKMRNEIEEKDLPQGAVRL